MNQQVEQLHMHAPERSLRTRVAAAAVAIGVLLTAAACSGTESRPDPTPVVSVEPAPTTEAPTPEATESSGEPTNEYGDPLFEGLEKPERKLRAAKIINTFEYSTTQLEYGRVENLDDGRGYTAGRAGFTSGTHDMLLVVKRYEEKNPDNRLSKYIDDLKRVDGTDSVKGLEGLPLAWRTSAKDPHFREAQDEIVDELYFNPAMDTAAEANVESALGQLIFWDTITQHGGGDDPDSFEAILERVGNYAGPEQGYLVEVLEEREKTLMNAHDKDTREAWRESVDRVQALRTILRSGNMELDPPIEYSVYGDRFNIVD